MKAQSTFPQNIKYKENKRIILQGKQMADTSLMK